MKKFLSLSIALSLLVVTTNIQAQQEELWSMETVMKGTILLVDLPIVNVDSSFIKNPPITTDIYTGIYEKASKPILELVKTDLIQNFTKINPNQIFDSSVRRMFDEYWNYYYQERNGEISQIENFKISEHQFSLIFNKHLNEINLICDKETPTLLLNKIFYDAFHIGAVQTVNIAVLSQPDGINQIMFKQLMLGPNTYINPRGTLNEWAKSGFNLQDKDVKNAIIEMPEDDEEGDEIELDLGDF